MRESNRKGYDITMNILWSECKRNNIVLESKEPPTRSAFSQARRKIKAGIIKLLLKKSSEEFEELYGINHLWKGLRVFAVDGTKYTLPASKELIKKFGCHNCGEVDAHYPQALVSVLFNIKSKIAYDVVIERNNGNERESLKKLCKSLINNDLVILDRGYPSHELISYLLKKKVNFIIRNPLSNTFKQVEIFLQEGSKDKIIELENPKKREKIKIRLLKSKNEKGEIRVFITSLLDQKRYSYDEIVNLYYERWEIEEHYKANKELFKVENFHSRDKNGVLQEIYSQLLLSNLTRIAMSEADKDNENKKGEPSFKNAVCIFERNINEIILCKDIEKKEKMYSDMLNEIRRVRYIKVTGRNYPRRSFKVITKWTRKKCLT